MERAVVLFKPVGMTPLEIIEAWRSDNPEYADVKLGFAGRLDPMAEGALLVLVGEENKRRDLYLELDKVYEVEIALGVSTDTHDCMGLVTEMNFPENLRNESMESEIKKILELYIGEIYQPYPAYSSKTVDGKPLYAWAREGRLGDITIPVARRHISSIELLSIRTERVQTLLDIVHSKLDRVTSGDFRIPEIRKSWDSHVKSQTDTAICTIVQIRVHCSSGTYMRVLASDIGKKLDLPALALSILRTHIGKYSILPAGQNRNNQY